MNKTLKILTASLAVVSFTAGAVAFSSRDASSALDVPGLNQQVQNHEARITNNEKDIKALQDNTSTQPAPERVVVPAKPDPMVESLTQAYPPAVENPATSQVVPEVPNTPDPHISVTISK